MHAIYLPFEPRAGIGHYAISAMVQVSLHPLPPLTALSLAAEGSLGRLRRCRRGDGLTFQHCQGLGVAMRQWGWCIMSVHALSNANSYMTQETSILIHTDKAKTEIQIHVEIETDVDIDQTCAVHTLCARASSILCVVAALVLGLLPAASTLFAVSECNGRNGSRTCGHYCDWPHVYDFS